MNLTVIYLSSATAPLQRSSHPEVSVTAVTVKLGIPSNRSCLPLSGVTAQLLQQLHIPLNWKCDRLQWVLKVSQVRSVAAGGEGFPSAIGCADGGGFLSAIGCSGRSLVSATMD